MVLKECEKFSQEPKGCSLHEDKTKLLLMRILLIFFLIIYLTAPRLTLGHCQLLPS